MKRHRRRHATEAELAELATAAEATATEAHRIVNRIWPAVEVAEELYYRNGVYAQVLATLRPRTGRA